MSTLPKKFDLTGRVALVTGSAGLLGKQHCLALLEIGATVVVTDFHKDRLTQVVDEIRTVFPAERIIELPMDVTSLESITSVRNEVEATGRFVEILVNNAAIDPKVTKSGSDLLEQSRIENFPIEQWNLQIAVGLTGAYLCSQVFGSEMARKRKGNILNIASDLAVIAPDQRLYRKPGLPDDQQPVKPVTYPVIKAGLIGLTRYLSTYWAKEGVRSNALSPGGVYNNQPDDFVSRLTSLIPLGRMAEVDEYRSAVQFLCSDASAYLNGQNIVMDGGRSAL